MLKSILFGTLLGITITSAHAAVVTALGLGNSVTVVDGRANFESPAILTDSPYFEGGMLFSRTGLYPNPSECGLGQCRYNTAFGFSGNNLYGVGTGGYFTIQSAGTSRFIGLEMAVESGFLWGDGWGVSSINLEWEAYDGASRVDAGHVFVPRGGIIGFSSPGGFTSLRLTSATLRADFTSTHNAPAIDTVRAQFASSIQIPEPDSAALALLGLAGLMGRLRRRQAFSNS